MLLNSSGRIADVRGSFEIFHEKNQQIKLEKVLTLNVNLYVCSLQFTSCDINRSIIQILATSKPTKQAKIETQT